MTERMRGRLASSTLAAVALLSVPLVGLALLLAVPGLDVHWQHQPSHFWLVLSIALVNVVLGVMTSEAAVRRDDARVFLVSQVLLVSAGFLALHALATPGVVVGGANAGFAIATPLGLFLAAGLAAASAIDLEGSSASPGITPWLRALRLVLLAVLIVWAVASVAGVPLLSRPLADEVPVPVRWATPTGVALYGFAASRYFRVYRRRGRVLPLAVAVAFVLLAEAMVAVAVGRTWHASWWEWHVLMAIAFGAITVAARIEYRRERSMSEALGGLYLERTLERLDRTYSDALARVATAVERDEPIEPVRQQLRREGFSGEELGVLERSAGELARVDGLLRGYLGSRLVESLQREPVLAELGGRESEVSVLFGDLVGFTTFSEDRPPAEVVEMLNTYWSAAVPAVTDSGGLIERFAGDAILAVFNALGDEEDHAERAVRAALAVQTVAERLSADHAEWPRFRVGVNTGPAVVGNVGTEGRRTFTAIGDTINVAARLQTAALPGQVLVGPATYERVASAARTLDVGTLSLKGRREPLEVHAVVSLDR
jgi:adenylate cyclase